jgi:hypothetical protein
MPGVRVTSVRRTVLVAVTLVTAQALLGGIIGIVTFGADREAPPASAKEPQLAGPPVVLPPSRPTPAERLSMAASRAVRTERPTSPRPPPVTSRSPAARTASPSPAASRTSPPPQPPMPTISIPDPDLVAPSVPAFEDPPVPVVGEPCAEAGADGRTADDKAVRCVRSRDGRLRWRLVQ